MRAAGIAVATLVVTVLSLLVTNVCDAQSRSPQIRGFADLGSTSFTASESFETILGASSGLVLGGGGEVVLPGNVFIAVRASRFHHTGHRVFLSEGERFDLGIQHERDGATARDHRRLSIRPAARACRSVRRRRDRLASLRGNV
jgi:hypothetical protein